jgi:hypothetical protein
VDLYALSENRQKIRKLSAEDCRHGTFRRGGRELAFPDGRPSITGLAVTRTALERGIEEIVRTLAPVKNDVPHRYE